MVYLSKIYTKTGDKGKTSLGHGKRVEKYDMRITAIGTVDEANTAIGMVFSLCKISPEISRDLQQIQQDLFVLGADLSVNYEDSSPYRIKPEHITFLENKIDFYNKDLDPLTSFVLPSGKPASSLMHNARVMTRKAERYVWLAAELEDHQDGTIVNLEIPKYLNRLSDLLFVLARVLNYGNEVLWDN